MYDLAEDENGLYEEEDMMEECDTCIHAMTGECDTCLKGSNFEDKDGNANS